jgi:hypothetical protein
VVLGVLKKIYKVRKLSNIVLEKISNHREATLLWQEQIINSQNSLKIPLAAILFIFTHKKSVAKLVIADGLVCRLALAGVLFAGPWR